jgi:hypothetical protein
MIWRRTSSKRRIRPTGGLGLGHTGPVPEGLVLFVLPRAGLLVVTGLIGERSD